jgi:ABC-2 type transport system ATP-binding protein
MATGTRVTAVWTPGPDEPAPHELPGVTAVERTPTRVILTSTDSDATAGALLRETAARDLTISPRSLDDAFVALTADPDTADPDTADPNTADSHQEAVR